MRTLEQIRSIYLAGAGVMGASFAQLFARAGYRVTLYDIAAKALEQAQRLIDMNQNALVEQGDLSSTRSDEIRSRISMTTDINAFSQADFVLEAIVENMDIKHTFWREVSNLVAEDVVLASNTSGLSITIIAEAVHSPARFAGMHWVNPPHLIPLVEVIAGEHTDEEALFIIKALGQDVGQTPITVYKDPPGFVLNRLQFALLREAFHIVQNGYASMEDVDTVVKCGLGLRYACVGPFETMDFGGVDVFHQVGSYLIPTLSNDTDVPFLLTQAREEGRYGLKTGVGFYDYSGDKAQKAIAKRDATFLRLNKALFGEKEEA